MSIYIRDERDLQAAIDRGTERRYTVGLDLGQTTDPTAIAVIERVRVPKLGVHQPIPADPTYEAPTFRVRHLERVKLGTSYPGIVAQVREIMATAPLVGSQLVIDQTGVGRPVVDMFRAAGLKPTGITITAGDGYTRDSGDYRVSKLMLVSKLSAALHSGHLHVAASLPEAAVLKSEMADFRVNYSASGYAQYEARSGRHDDLVLAVAISLWHSATVGQQRVEQRWCSWG
jgi:hypothetical protein